MAIILLTVLVKVLLIPLTHRAMVGQEAMKKLQPKIEELKKKFPEDKERQQMEMMKAYQEAGVNPFGSCLMLLVQLPVWAALFTTLRNSYELYGEPFTSHFLTDLTIKDPTYLLPRRCWACRRSSPAASAAGARCGAAADDGLVHADLLHRHHAELPGGARCSTSSPTTS